MGLFTSLRRDPAVKLEMRTLKIENMEHQRWPDPETRAIVHRYQDALGITHIRNEFPKKYLKYLPLGYFEPIPAAWANDPYSPLCRRPQFSFSFDDAGEERLYWILNHSRHPGLAQQKYMRPDEFSEMRLANARMRRAVPVDIKYASQYDTFRTKYGRKGYSKQVPPLPIHQDFRELARTHPNGAGIDTMLMIDVSGSMGFDHYQSGFEQPRHIDVVHSILGRAMHFTTPRDHYHKTDEEGGIDTVLFSSYGRHVGKLGEHNFPRKWQEIQWSVGGGTQVMSGWQKVKQLHFEKHGRAVGATFHPVYGWQAPPDMVKLSLLVLLDGEAVDMDEWELEILGETWCYVTILLIGRDGCPNHHRHANELERVARANQHVQFYDCQGRMNERYLLHNVLQSLYPAQPPSDDEILNPKYDHPPPAYYA